MDYDIKNSTRYFNYDSLRLLKDIWHIDGDIINMIRDDMKYVENNIGVPTDNSYNTGKHILFSTLLLLAFKDKKFDDVKNYIYEMGLIRKFMG
jgi:phosphoenolpyruvate carboxylase